MHLTIDLGEISVPTSGEDRLLEICLVWLDKKKWLSVPFEKQKETYIFIERRYRNCQIFYCSALGDSAYELDFVHAAEADEKKLSEDTLRKVFTKYIQPLIKTRYLRSEEITIPKFSIK